MVHSFSKVSQIIYDIFYLFSGMHKVFYLLRSFKPPDHPLNCKDIWWESQQIVCIYFDLKFYKWTLCIYSLRKTWETRLKMDQTRKVLIKIHSGWWIKTILLDLFQNKNQLISKKRSKQKRPRPNGFRKYCSTFT